MDGSIENIIEEKLFVVLWAKVEASVLDDIRESAPGSILLSAPNELLISVGHLISIGAGSIALEAAHEARRKMTNWLWLQAE
jgi:hypothetical protein